MSTIERISDWSRWARERPVPERIVRSVLWSVLAAVFTRAYLLRVRAQVIEVKASLGEPPDHNDKIRWFEALSLGFVQRRWTRYADDAPSTPSGR